jgi:hypothetical protein
MFSNFFFENCAVFENKRKNILHPGRSQMTIWRLRIACWILKATDTHSKCVILMAFLLQNGFTNVSRYMHAGCLNHESPLCTTVAIPLSLPPS